MAFTWRLGLAIAVLAAALGAGLGYWTTPRYRPPADAGEQRLRERAAQ